MTFRERLTPKEIKSSPLVWEGLTNREIGQTRRLEPLGTGDVRGRPRPQELARC